ncbi:MAG: helix-turn-helix protein [Chloroflexi bacterium ADurb.Bin360]|nr:MAG: helix-turn-helix protein [Chloroflexi bacterium ADurb.Bin360]
MSIELSEYLRQELLKRNLSRRELSRRADLSTMAVNHIINNPASNPTVETCVGIAKALEVSPELIFQLAGYSIVGLADEIDPEVKALAIYLNGLPPEIRVYALKGAWATAQVVTQAIEESVGGKTSDIGAE